jgi:hypothetical protein
MLENNQNATPGDENESQASSADNTTQQGQTGDEQNPQEGKEWDNYQTKELSANEEGGGISAEEAAQVFEKDGE